MLHVTAITATIRQDIYKNVSETVNIVEKRGFSPYNCHHISVCTFLDNIAVCFLCYTINKCVYFRTHTTIRSCILDSFIAYILTCYNT